MPISEDANRPRRRRRHHQSWWDKIWKDRHGKVVIYQNPNRWLIGFAAIVILSFFTTGQTATFMVYIAMGVLTVWAVLEAWKGVNYFRKAMGLGVLALLVAWLFGVGI